MLNSFESSKSPDSIIQELNERKRRESNVIALGLPESNKAAGPDRLEDDKKSLLAVLSVELSAKVPEFKIRRLGQQQSGRTRPMLIETRSAVDAREIFKLNQRNDSTVTFKPDLTPRQQQHLNNLRTELDILIKNGDTGKSIKYIRGIPQIVNKNFRQINKEDKTENSTNLLSKHSGTSNKAVRIPNIIFS